ncbi:HNH endonuclease [Cryobacterium sp. Hh7]|uniref:HNH endonuclease n=1 Tax=Cryobacterium sp. Hh7 TaxID=1259159 RepID=UPI00106D7024|nr:HNH endonuclease [Cryobacterium sp. Hh7]
MTNRIRVDMTKSTCTVCAVEFTSTNKKKYCTPLCASRAYNAARKADGRLATLRAQLKDERATWQAANAHKYRGKYWDARECEACGISYRVRSSEPTRACSLWCGTFLTYGAWPQCKLNIATCLECECHWVDRTGYSRYCEACGRSGVHHFKIDQGLRQRLYALDKWTCWLCGEGVDMEADTNSDYAPSLDHVTPLSRGGRHNKANLRTAHRICNSLRQDRPA